jgi:hypothetical protein
MTVQGTTRFPWPDAAVFLSSDILDKEKFVHAAAPCFPDSTRLDPSKKNGNTAASVAHGGGHINRMRRTPIQDKQGLDKVIEKQLLVA